MRILFLAPHISTGGLPQYLCKKIECLKDDHQIFCIEYANHSDSFVVQRARVQDAIGKNYLLLGDDKSELIDLIKEIAPDVVSLEEIPEYFLDRKLAEKIYSTSRTYSIVETTHDSSFDISQKVFLPDKFFAISRFILEKFSKLGMPCELFEYPIEDKPNLNKGEAQRRLGLSPNKKHVINVGLFTSRKNQAEVIEYARKMIDYPVQFHFIGNQADNFKWYWEPLMKDFPSNCKWWGERKDVDLFYEAADLFLFTSRGSAGDMETMPLVIREAIGSRVPSLIYNLPVYLNCFDEFKTINYLDFDDLSDNINKIVSVLNIKKNKSMKITSSWDPDEQKMHYSTDVTIDFPVVVALRDYKSDAVMWSTVYEVFPSGVNFWMIPVVKHVHDYSADPVFTGIKLCIYNKETGEQLYEKPYFAKFVDMPALNLSNSIPYYNNYLEFFVTKKYNAFLKPKYENVVDAGANVGVFTFFLLKNKIAKNITCVECDYAALKDLQKNVEINSNVKVIPKAISDKNTQIKFYHSDCNPVISSTLAPDKLKHHFAGTKGDVAYTVDTVTIKELIDDLKIIDLLKIDIEGAEYELILNLDDSLFKYINNLFIECHFFEQNYKEKYDSLLAKLRKNGYLVKEFTEGQSDRLAGASESILAEKIV